MFGAHRPRRNDDHLTLFSAAHPSLELRVADARKHAWRRRPPRTGTHVGSYDVGSLLGSGGMGDVYAATHQLLGRPAAIKFIRREVLVGDDDDCVFALRRFRREAKVAASLRSPHVVQLYDFGVTDDGTLYIAMELLSGICLERLVERFGPVPPERVISLLRQACEALGEMHATGHAHRDVKPANIYVCRLGLEDDFVKITDLGLVHPPRGATAEHAALRARKSVVGTPAYMAPEVARGAAGDEGADVYGIGCVAYWLLTGRLVFSARSAEEMLARHVRDKPIPPSRRSELSIPPTLEHLVLSCLEKKPARRPRSAEELRDRLAACEVSQPWTESRARQWWDSHRPDERDEGVAEAVGG